jgi:hypothetical protein
LIDFLFFRPSKNKKIQLHPVFQEDEIILIVMGAVLGVIIGFLQALGLGG